jgi:hypothetical protein
MVFRALQLAIVEFPPLLEVFNSHSRMTHDKAPLIVRRMRWQRRSDVGISGRMNWPTLAHAMPRLGV